MQIILKVECTLDYGEGELKIHRKNLTRLMDVPQTFSYMAERTKYPLNNKWNVANKHFRYKNNQKWTFFLRLYIFFLFFFLRTFVITFCLRYIWEWWQFFSSFNVCYYYEEDQYIDVIKKLFHLHLRSRLYFISIAFYGNFVSH